MIIITINYIKACSTFSTPEETNTGQHIKKRPFNEAQSSDLTFKESLVSLRGPIISQISFANVLQKSRNMKLCDFRTNGKLNLLPGIM